MAAQAETPQLLEKSERAVCSAAEPVGGVRYVARQPILDLRGKVHGYELLFRDGPEAVFRGDGNAATRTMLDNTVLYGLGRLTAGLPAFVNCTEESLTRDLVHVMPSGMTVLEILEDIEPPRPVIEACRYLKASGFRLALDDFVWRPGIEPLVEIADYIKIDFSICDREERRRLLDRLSRMTVALVAEKVETAEQVCEARDEGFMLLQGFYFCRPVLMENRKVPANRLSQVEILRLMRSERLDLRELTRQVERDTSLTYRLLRLMNSPACAMQQEVRSVQAALIAVGEETFRRMATLAITSELNAGQPAELLRMACVRARFCELGALFAGLDETEQYLLGLLSLLPAMLRMPMRELAPSLPLRNEIRRALEGEKIPERSLLCWLEAHERGNWDMCDLIADQRDLEQEDLFACYEEALRWAESVLEFS
jgi:EAL and modified HD-GYP domain-containing signal transduction protein